MSTQIHSFIGSSGLLQPAATVMDLNIGAALWLAARASGRVTVYQNGGPVQLPGSCSDQVYTSAARIVLVGHGADEQCAGYGRHRTKFRQQVAFQSAERAEASFSENCLLQPVLS